MEPEKLRWGAGSSMLGQGAMLQSAGKCGGRYDEVGPWEVRRTMVFRLLPHIRSLHRPGADFLLAWLPSSRYADLLSMGSSSQQATTRPGSAASIQLGKSVDSSTPRPLCRARTLRAVRAPWRGYL